MNAEILFQTIQSAGSSKKLASNTQASAGQGTTSYSSNSSSNMQSFKKEMDKAFDKKASTTKSTPAEKQELDKCQSKETEKLDDDVTLEQQALAAVQAQAQAQPTAEINEVVGIMTEVVNQVAQTGQVQLVVGQSVQKQGDALPEGVLQATDKTSEGPIQLPFQNAVDTVKAALLKEAAQQQTQQQTQTQGQSQAKGLVSETSDTNDQTKTTLIETVKSDDMTETVDTDSQQVPVLAKAEPLDMSKVNIKVADAPVDTTKANAAEQFTDKIIYKMSEGKQEFDLQLNPKELGKLNIKLTFENGNAQVLITSSNSKAQNLMASLTDNIRGILERNTGVNSTIQLQQSDMLEGQYDQDNFNGESEARHSSQQQKEKTQATDDLSFIDKLRLGLIEGLEIAV